MDDKTLPLYFQLFNEIGIIEQLSRAQLEAELPNGFLVSHFSVLNHLIRVRDGGTPLELANAFQVPKTTMTHTLSGLEKADLIVMKANPSDGRSKQVWITESGRNFRDQAIQKLGENMGEFARQFPAEFVEDMVPRLAEIRQFLDAARDK